MFCREVWGGRASWQYVCMSSAMRERCAVCGVLRSGDATQCIAVSVCVDVCVVDACVVVV